MTTPNTPIEDEHLSACCAVKVSTDGHNRICPNCSFTCDFMSDEVLAWKDKAVAEAQNSVLDHLIEAFAKVDNPFTPAIISDLISYKKRLARLTTPTKERENK